MTIAVYVSPDTVQAALDDLIYHNSDKPPELLLHLTCVHQYLIEHRVPPAKHARLLALQSILVDQLLQLYRQQCQILAISLPEVDPIDHQECAENLRLAASQPNKQLRCLGVLYAKYYQAHLEITPQQMADWMHVDVRTIRRLTERGIILLTNRVIEHEAVARRRQHQHQLKTHLPRVLSFTIGREATLNKMLQACHQQDAHTILITGPPGIGKTHLAAIFCETLIIQNDTNFVSILWVTAPPNRDMALATLNDQIDGPFSLSDFLEHSKTIIVLDGITSILPDITSVLSEFGRQTLVLMTAYPSEVAPVVGFVDSHIKVEPLSVVESEKFIEELSRFDSNRERTEPHITIIQQAAGIPYELVFRSRTHEIPKDAKMDDTTLVGALAWLAEGRSSDHTVFAINTIKACLAKQPLSSVRPPDNIPDWILDQFWHAEDIGRQDDILDWLRTPSASTVLSRIADHLLDRPISHDISLLLSSVESVLRRLQPEHTVRLKLLLGFWRHIFPGLRVHTWRQLILESAHHDETRALEVACCEMHSRFGENELFYERAERLLLDLGKTGAFSLQSELRYIQAKHLRRQGRLSHALSLLNAVTKTPYCTTTLRNSIEVERLRIYLETQDATAARQQFDVLNVGDRQAATRMLVDMYFCELCYLEGNNTECIQQCENLLGNPAYQRYVGYLHALVAQCYVRLRDGQRAISAFNQALNDFAISMNTIALSRLATNYSAFLLELDRAAQAEHLLNWVQSMRQETPDILGDLYTQHNHTLLHQRDL